MNTFHLYRTSYLCIGRNWRAVFLHLQSHDITESHQNYYHPHCWLWYGLGSKYRRDDGSVFTTWMWSFFFVWFLVCTPPINHLSTTHPLNILLTQSVNKVYQDSLSTLIHHMPSTHLINTPYPTSIVTHLITIPYHLTLSLYLVTRWPESGFELKDYHPSSAFIWLTWRLFSVSTILSGIIRLCSCIVTSSFVRCTDIDL